MINIIYFILGLILGFFMRGVIIGKENGEKPINLKVRTPASKVKFIDPINLKEEFTKANSLKDILK
jgi:hypothetical protein